MPDTVSLPLIDPDVESFFLRLAEWYAVGGPWASPPTLGGFLAWGGAGGRCRLLGLLLAAFGEGATLDRLSLRHLLDAQDAVSRTLRGCAS